MIEVSTYKNRSVAVMGLGRSGLAAAKALQASGARVLAWDDGEAARAKASEIGIELTDLGAADLTDIDTLVLSPGIPHTFPAPHPIARRARESGARIVCDIELLAQSNTAARFIGVTGTNGKSTTTALIGHILGKAGYDIEVGGNLGPAVMAMRPLDETGIYVLEMSSYQLERTPSIVFNVAVLLNITPDHLDRHGGLDGYVAAKLHIFQNQRPQNTAVIGIDDLHCRRAWGTLAASGRQNIVPIAVGHEVEDGVYVIDGKLIDGRYEPARALVDLSDFPHLPGRHNWQNAAAAYAACRAAGVDPSVVVDGLASFPGLRHRQELVAVIDGVPFINDSKATNAEAAARALACYDNIYWIAGGRAKEGGIAALAPYFDRVAHVFLIGEAATSFAETIAGRIPTTMAYTLDSAVWDAHLRATAEGRTGAVVLLSPACASFDQFRDFEHRGDVFRAAVEAIGAGGGGTEGEVTS